MTALYSGNATDARRLLEECLYICLQVKNTVLLARVCMALAEMALWVGELDQAQQWLAESLAYQAVPRRITIVELQRLFIAARLATLQGEYRRAAILFGLAEAVHGQIHHIYAGPMVPLVNDARTAVRQALDPADFTQAFIAGKHMSLWDRAFGQKACLLG